MSLLQNILHKKEDKETVLILEIAENLIYSAIVSLDTEGIRILGKSQTGWKSEEELIDAADTAVSQAEKEIDQGILVEKAIFILPRSYTEGDSIKEQYLASIKKICDKLDLKPHGFTDLSQAVSYLLEEEEGIAPTLLFIHYAPASFSVSFIKIGKVFRHIESDRKDTIHHDITHIVNEIGDENVLPSKILVDGAGVDLTKISKDLEDISWKKYSSFLHTPKILIFSPEQRTAMHSRIATFKYMGSINDNILTDDNKTPPQGIPDPAPSYIPTQTDNQDKKGDSDTFASDNLSLPSGESSDFSEDFGFTKEEEKPDVKEEKAIRETETVKRPSGPEGINSYYTVIDEEKPSSSPVREKSALKLPEIPKFTFPFGKIILPILALLILAAPLTFFMRFLYFTYPKANLNLIVYPTKRTNTADLIFTLNKESAGANQNAISVNSISEEVSGSKTEKTTGKTKVGEKAKGEITIYNKTDKSKTFSKGAVITSANLNFILDDDVSIASSSETGEGLMFGKAAGSITALGIGPEANLPGNTVFSFKDYPQSSFTAKNIKSLTGGTSRDVVAVSREDVADLENKLVEELVSQGKSAASLKLEPGEVILDKAITTTILSKKFDREVGEEAGEVSLNLTLRMDFPTYRLDDLYNLPVVKSSEIPEGFIADYSRFGIILTETKKDKNENLTANAQIISFLIPDIDRDNIISSVSGKTYGETSEFLKNTPSIAGFQIVNISSSPLLINRLPVNKNNILVSVITR